MLVLCRKEGERIIIDGDIEVVVLALRGNRVRLGFIAPPEVSIHRQELAEKVGMYKSSDPSQRARAALWSNAALRGVECEHRAGALVLRGRVSSFYAKQLAQELVRSADGERRIVNELEIEDPTQSPYEGLANEKRQVHSKVNYGKHGGHAG